MKRFIRSLIIILISAVSLPSNAAEEVMDVQATWQKRLDTAADQLKLPDLGDEKLREIRSELDEIRIEATDRNGEIQPDYEAVNAELETLGPSPEEGQEPESEAIASQRAEIKSRLKEVESRLKEVELVDTRASLLLEEISQIRRSRFSRKLFEGGPSPLSISVWKQAIPQIIAASSSGRQALGNIFISDPVKKQVRDSALAILSAAILAILFAWPLHNWLLRRFGRDPTISKPQFMEAMRAMLIVGAVRALLPTAVAALVYVVAVNTAVITPASSEIAKALFLGFVFFAWVVAFFRASLSPQHAAWRVLPVPDNFAAGMWHFVILLALVYAVDIVLTEVLKIYGARLEITVLRDYLIALLIIVLLAILLLRQDMWRPAEPPDAKPRWRSVRIVIAIILLIFPLIGLFGYVALVRFVATQALLTGGLFFLLLILHRLGREFIAQIATGDNWIARRIHDYLHFDSESTRRLEFWSGLVFDVILFASGLLAALFVWGANRDDVANWVNKALFGFNVGRIHISLIDITIAILVIMVLVILTRFIQRVLAEKILPQTRIDTGIQESIRQATGYVGIVIAAIAGIAALGLDLSNFALVAGALTVGIGFGLQNVVNNFVSGLILLVERPIKVGDWIVVGDQQGYVKRIRVRATEILTFDRSSVFVPNSELISGVVTNWTHADKLGRVIIPIGVAYGSDTELVHKTLLEVATAHPDVLEDPAPVAVFRGFGDSSLDFELRCMLEDVEKKITVTSDLCFSIDKAFRDLNIEIPFPQQDVYIRKMPD